MYWSGVSIPERALPVNCARDQGKRLPFKKNKSIRESARNNSNQGFFRALRVISWIVLSS